MTGFHLAIAARTIWQEARGESEQGQRAVAHVIVNRMKTGRWGWTLASVCLWRAQFSGWRSEDPNFQNACSLPDDSGPLEKFAGFVTDALNGEPDPTEGATHYYSDTMIMPPPWAATGVLTVQIGHHRFYKGVK